MKIAAGLVTVSLALLLTGGCAAGTSPATKPLVLTSVYPLQFLAERVAGDDATVTNLVSPGAEPHDLELTAKQVADLSEAAVVLHVGGFQPAVDDALAQASPDDVIDLLDEIDPIDAAGDEEAHEDEHGHDDAHEHGPADPHVWLDPMNLVIGAKALSAALADADPAHSRAYLRRANGLITDLHDLDDEFRAGLKSCERRTMVTAHAAFGYLARAYELDQIPIAGLDPSQEPSTSDLADIAREVEHEEVTTIFTERLVSPAVAQTVARETGAFTAVLDPLEGLADETSSDDYFSLMRANLAAIRTANGCT